MLPYKCHQFPSSQHLHLILCDMIYNACLIKVGGNLFNKHPFFWTGIQFPVRAIPVKNLSSQLAHSKLTSRLAHFEDTQLPHNALTR